MSLYRCAACGSSKVFPDEKSEGYSIVKGAVGTALFGTGGATMGVNGKCKTYYHCSECGQTLTYTMPTSIKRIIDEAIINPDKVGNEMVLKAEKNIMNSIEEKQKNV